MLLLQFTKLVDAVNKPVQIRVVLDGPVQTDKSQRVLRRVQQHQQMAALILLLLLCLQTILSLLQLAHLLNTENSLLEQKIDNAAYVDVLDHYRMQLPKLFFQDRVRLYNRLNAFLLPTVVYMLQ